LKLTTLYVTHDQEEAMALSDRVVVMQRGRILQIGAPETVYRRPASREVAAFFGTPNLIEARATSCRATDGGEWLVTVDGPAWQGTCRAACEFSPGASVLVVIRPEDVALADAGTPAAGKISWQGRVIDGVFRGPRRTLTIDVAGLRFMVECPATRAARVGDTVGLLVDAENAWAVHPG
jgi:iron(III) transport system ATP-binding protein